MINLSVPENGRLFFFFLPAERLSAYEKHLGSMELIRIVFWNAVEVHRNLTSSIGSLKQKYYILAFIHLRVSAVIGKGDVQQNYHPGGLSPLGGIIMRT
jgi:hypothetical protein